MGLTFFIRAALLAIGCRLSALSRHAHTPPYPPLRKAFALLLFAFLCAQPLAAQDERSAAEARLRELQELIRQDEERLQETREEAENSIETLNALNRQITLRAERMRNYRRRLDELSQERDSIRSSVASLEAEIADLKEEYRRRAIHAYKYGRLNDLALILAARSINQMLVRIRYLRYFAAQRRRKLTAIETAGAALEARREDLQARLARTQELLTESEAERANLARLQQDRRDVLAALQAQEATLTQELERNRSAAEQLESRIRELIAAETRRRNTTVRTPAEESAFIELSGSFAQNRGQLPWPSDGVIIEPYGEVVNPEYGTITQNPGLLIATGASDPVRAVFDGRVISVDIIPHFGTYVVIEHGEYHSVYSNFSLLYIGEGETVRAGQNIGRAGTDAEPKGRGVFFALFKDGRPFDPRPWLQAK